MSPESEAIDTLQRISSRFSKPFFRLERSPTDRAMCKISNEKMAEGELRVGLLNGVASSYGTFKKMSLFETPKELVPCFAALTQEKLRSVFDAAGDLVFLNWQLAPDQFLQRLKTSAEARKDENLDDEPEIRPAYATPAGQVRRREEEGGETPGTAPASKRFAVERSVALFKGLVPDETLFNGKTFYTTGIFPDFASDREEFPLSIGVAVAKDFMMRCGATMKSGKLRVGDRNDPNVLLLCGVKPGEKRFREFEDAGNRIVAFDDVKRMLKDKRIKLSDLKEPEPTEWSAGFDGVAQ